ncbi:MAG: response regulator [Ardenticatenaceae bacterium]
MSENKINICQESNLSVGTNILVVDDMQFNLRLLIEVLKIHEYEARPALNGSQALSAAQSNPPDLILLDIVMPVMNGYEVCRQLKADERTRDIPVIFMSGLNEVLDKVKGFSVGGVDYITKPFEVEEVLARVKTHLTLRNLQQSLQNKNAELQQEIIKRKQAEELLAEYNRTLEQKVHERTTKLAQATREAQEARLAAEAASEAKSVFLAKVSHELRTPLNAILGFAQVMARSQTLPHEQQENLDIIKRSGQHLLTLINDILDFSKSEAGRMALHESNFDLYRLLEELEQMFRFKAEAKKIKFNVARDSTLPQYVRTDSVKLRQVLIRLVDNAIKFTSQGSVCCRVGVVSTDATYSLPKRIGHIEHANLHFEVQDTGSGIASDELERIFSAFVQSETGMQKEEAPGLGLSISRQFVRLMGGEMSVTSQPGHGTTFKFDLLVRLVDASDIKEVRATRRVIALEPNQPPYRILIVDQQKENRQELINLLQPLGFALKQASNGQEAIDVWQTWQPHLIFLDTRTAVMDGYEAIKRIKETHAASRSSVRKQATAIIALTASTLEEERASADRSGCDDFLPKPFREADIFDLMHKHIGVRYIYDEDKDQTSSSSASGHNEALTPAALAALPASLLAPLEEAVNGSDMELMEQVIAQISLLDPALATQLTTLADEFEYDEILELIEEAHDL